MLPLYTDPSTIPQPRLLLLPATFFQLPLPSLINYLPVSSFPQHILRTTLVLYTLLIAFPLILVIAPISVLIHILTLTLDPQSTASFSRSPLVFFILGMLRCIPVLPIHPHNLPPYRSLLDSIIRAVNVYFIGTLIWSWTGTGVAPDYGLSMSRWIAAIVCFLGRYVTGTQLQVKEELMEPLKPTAIRGVLKLGQANPVIGFWLTSPIPLQPTSPPIKPRRALLFLAGGGYVTAFPLAHPFVFSLIPRLHDVALLAPNVRKALSMDRAFPAPVLDALAGYAHLRRAGYEPENITIMGDSAGGGMSWSLISYLAAIRDPYLGIPGGLILISPWLSLPPIPSSRYPDVLDDPMLLNAARCYLGRFPLLKNRPNPFASDSSPALSALSRRWRRLRAGGGVQLEQNEDEEEPFRSAARDYEIDVDNDEELLQPEDETLHAADGQLAQGNGASATAKGETVESEAMSFLSISEFEKLSSHHPFISPSTDLEHPFLRTIFATFAEPREEQSCSKTQTQQTPSSEPTSSTSTNRSTRKTTRVLIHSGSAEWFHGPAEAFGATALKCGVDVTIEREIGGVHAESCVLPAEFGGAGAGLIGAIVRWLEEGESGD